MLEGGGRNIMILTYRTLRVEIKRYADRMEKHPNIVSNLMRNVKILGRLKRRLSQDLCTWYCNFIGHALQGLLKLSNVLLNVTLNDSL